MGGAVATAGSLQLDDGRCGRARRLLQLDEGRRGRSGLLPGRGALRAPRLFPYRGAFLARGSGLGGGGEVSASMRARAVVAPATATPIAWLIASTRAAPASAPVSRRVPSGSPAASRPAVARAAQPANANAAAGRTVRAGGATAAAEGEGHQQHRGRETTVPEGGPTHHRDECADRACRNDGSQPPVLLIDRTRVGVGDDPRTNAAQKHPPAAGSALSAAPTPKRRAAEGGLTSARSQAAAPAHRSGRAATRADRRTARTARRGSR